jgi:hypothetical protein
MRRGSIHWLLSLLVAALLCGSARGDGGTVRCSEVHGDYRITVFTSPAPLRAGPIDVSILVQDKATDKPVPDVEAEVTLTPLGRPGPSLSQPATRGTATNKLFHAALFELPSAGSWQVEAVVTGAGQSATCRFVVEAAAPPPPWVELAPWLGWPALVIAFFGVHQFLVWRRAK